MVLRGKDLMTEKIISVDEEDGVREAAKLALAWQRLMIREQSITLNDSCFWAYWRTMQEQKT